MKKQKSESVEPWRPLILGEQRPKVILGDWSKKSQAYPTERVFRLEGMVLGFSGSRESNPFLCMVLYGLLNAFISVFLLDLQTSQGDWRGKYNYLHVKMRILRFRGLEWLI